MFFSENLKVQKGGSGVGFFMSISWSKKGVFFKNFLKKVIDMYYGENHDFLKKDIYGLRRMFF